MEERVFVDKGTVPDDELVREALGPAAEWFGRFVAYAEGLGWRGEWKYHNKRYGWTWKAERKKTSLFWLAPVKGGFVVGAALRKEEKQALLDGEFPETMKRPARAAKEFPEGYAVQWPVRDRRAADEAFAVISLVGTMR